MMLSNDGPNKAVYVSTAILSGVFYALAWWFIIDAGVYAHHIDDPRKMKFVYILPGILATLGVFMINSFDWTDFAGEGFSEKNSTRAKICFFLGIVVLLCTLFGAIFVAVENYFTSKAPKSDWPGVAIILNLVFQFVSAVTMRVGRITVN